MTVLIESVTKIIPKATRNMPEIIDIILRCRFIFFKNLEKKLINMLANMNGSPSPSEKTARSMIP